MLFDFSCSKFLTIGRSTEIPPTVSRALRRALIRDGFHGGKRKTRKNKKHVKNPKKITKTIKRNPYGKNLKEKKKYKQGFFYNLIVK